MCTIIWQSLNNLQNHYNDKSLSCGIVIGLSVAMHTALPHQKQVDLEALDLMLQGLLDNK